MVKEIFLDFNLKVIDGDEAFYYLHKDGELNGTVQTHVDDFELASTQHPLIILHSAAMIRCPRLQSSRTPVHVGPASVRALSLVEVYLAEWIDAMLLLEDSAAQPPVVPVYPVASGLGRAGFGPITFLHMSAFFFLAPQFRNVRYLIAQEEMHPGVY